MNLYKLHDKPSSLLHHDIAHLHVPHVLKDKISNDLKMNRRSRYDKYSEHELKTLIKEPASAYWLVSTDSLNRESAIPKSMIPEIERIIASHSDYAYYYAENLRDAPWSKFSNDEATVKLAEKSIAAKASTAFYYSTVLLKKPWLQGEPAIMKSEFADDYENFKAGKTDHLWTPEE